MQKALLFCEFHDILPGTSIEPAKEKSLRTLSFGLELAAKWKRKAFFALLFGEKEAAAGEYPIFIYNPHPYQIEDDFTCEFQLANQNWTSVCGVPVVTQDGEILPSQLEKEECNLNLDWRKRVTFHGTMKPSSMNRFSVTIQMSDKKSEGQLFQKALDGTITFDNGRMAVVINGKTGLIDSYQADGVSYLQPGAGVLRVMKSDCDPWGMNRQSYGEEEGFFRLLGKEEGSRYSGTLHACHQADGCTIPSVRVIETGAVRTVVEAVFGYKESYACVHYILPVRGTKIQVIQKIHWFQKGNLLKWEIPTNLKGQVFSETAYGVMEQTANGEEKVFHRWCGYFDKKADKAVTIINEGNYGADFRDGKMRISLIHSAAYSAHPIGERPLLVRDRYLPYIDQGEREFSFTIQGGPYKERRESVTAQAVITQEKPVIVPAFPSGEGKQAKSIVTIDDKTVILSAFRKMEHQNAFLLRLFESTGEERRIMMELPELGIVQELVMKPFEVKTCKLLVEERRFEECGIFGEETSK